MLNLGLLFDVDGPLASPVTRTVAIDSIFADLVALARAGVPIAFITGRSDDFIRKQVVDPLIERGLGAALVEGGAGMFGVFEKGAVWAAITPEGMGEITVDESVAVPASIVSEMRALVHDRFSETLFFDSTKRAMVSAEQHPGGDAATFEAVQREYDDTAFEVLVRHGLGVKLGDRVHADANGDVPFRIDPTNISTDIESVLLDKDRGAERAVAYFAALADLPRRWRTVGDSRSDYLMADHLHSAGFEVAHVDVLPSAGLLERPYPIETIDGLIYDEAGAAFLAHWVDELQLR